MKCTHFHPFRRLTKAQTALVLCSLPKQRESRSCYTCYAHTQEICGYLSAEIFTLQARAYNFNSPVWPVRIVVEIKATLWNGWQGSHKKAASIIVRAIKDAAVSHHTLTPVCFCCHFYPRIQAIEGSFVRPYVSFPKWWENSSSGK